MSRLRWLILLLLVGGLLGPAPASAGEGLSARVEPKRLVLGQSSSGRLLVKGPAHLKASQIQAVARLGRIGKFHAEGRGRFTARYRLPDAKRPEVDLITISVRGAKRVTPTAVAVPLWKEASVEARSEPNATTWLELAGERGESVRAGGRGEVVLSVVAPPGAREAKVKFTRLDGSSGEGRQKLPFKVPGIRSSMVLVGESSLPADGRASAEVWVFASDGRGRLSAREAPSFKVDVGELTAVRKRSPGVFVASYRAPLRLTPAQAVIRAHFPGQRPMHQKVELQVSEGGELTLQSSSHTLPASRAASAMLTAVLTSSDGRPVQGEEVVFSCDGGTLSPTISDASGTYRAIVSGPWEAREEVLVTASGPTGLNARVKLRLLPVAEPLSVSFEPQVLRAGSPVPGSLSIKVRDSDGLPVADGTRVELEGEGLTVPGSTKTRDGVALVSLLAGPMAGEAVVIVRARGLERRYPIAVQPAVAARLQLKLDDLRLRADGEEKTTLTAKVEDRFGNPVDDAQLSLSSNQGSLSGLQALGEGRYLATYTAPDHRRAGSAAIEVHGVGDLFAEGSLELLEVPRDWALAVKAGGLWNLGTVVAPVVRLEAARRMPGLAQNFLLAWGVGYAGNRVDQRAHDEGGTPVEADLQMHQIELSGGGAVEPVRIGALRSTLGLGFDLVALYMRLDSSLQSSTRELRWLPGFHLRGELEYGIGSGAVVGELRYAWRAPVGITLAGGQPGGPSLSAGYRLRF